MWLYVARQTSTIDGYFVCAEDISFPTIGTDYNGSLEAFNRYITGVTYE